VLYYYSPILHTAWWHDVIPTNLHAPTQTMPAGAYLIIYIPNENLLLTTNSSSKYLDTAIWSPRPFLRLVFRTKSRASACPDAGSSGLSLILVSVGSPVRINHQTISTNKIRGNGPGTIDQWSNTCRQNACPCVAVRRSVSNPLASITGINALTVYRGDPAFGIS